MSRYRLEVLKTGRRWCDIIVEDSDPGEILRDVVAKFPEGEGYLCSLVREEEARRIVEVTDQARIIGISYNRVPVTIAATEIVGAEEA
jgi:hypothetical protein